MFVENKVALVTGGASGIGFCIGQELLKNGAKGVAIVDIDIKQGDLALKTLVNEFGENKAIFVKANVIKKEELEDAMKKTVEVFKNFDILVNNAGIWNDSIWETELLINLNATIHGCIIAMEHYLPKYRSSSEAVIVNIASIYGLEGAPVSPVYNASKHGVVGFGKCLAMKEHYNCLKVKIVTICPGHTVTPLQNDMVNKALNERYAQAIKALQSDPMLPLQKPEVVSKALIKILDRSENGSFWVIDGSKVCEVELAEIKQLKKLQTIEL